MVVDGSGWRHGTAALAVWASGERRHGTAVHAFDETICC